MSYATGFKIAYMPRSAFKTGPVQPAHLGHEDGRRFTFAGGYGDENRTPTQEGCRLIADWMAAQGLTESPLTLTAALDAAKAWAGAE